MDIETKKVNFYYIPSESEKGKKYVVRIYSDGEVRCECPGFIFGGHCKHIQKAIDQSKKGNKTN